MKLFFFIIFFSLFCAGNDFPSLQKAILNKNIKAVRELLRKGENPNEEAEPDHSTAMMCAVDIDDTEILNMLIKGGGAIYDLDATGSSLLDLALSLHHFNSAKCLIGHGLNPNSSYKFGETSITEFIDDDSDVKFLLNNGANPNWRVLMGHEKMAPLELAIQSRFDFVLWKDSLNAPMSQFDSLTFMRMRKNLNVIQALLNHGAYPSGAMNNQGYTYLHGAAYMCDAELVKLLLLHGANKNVVDSGGVRPYDVAVKQSCRELESILK